MNEQNEKFMRELRCTHCHHLLMLEYIFNGRIEIKCGSCGEMNNFNFKYYKNYKKKNDTIDVSGVPVDLK